jgi:hypothetical protein
MLLMPDTGVMDMIGRTALRIFLLPGNLVSDALGARAVDDKIMIRSLINMLVWNLVAVLGVLAFWQP